MKKNELKEGDRIRLIKTTHPIKLPAYGTIDMVHENDPYFPYRVDLDSTPNGYLSNKFWVSSDDEWEIVGSSGATQLELDFDALLGEESPHIDNSLYCDCFTPNLKKNIACGNTFSICVTCKKERL